jgi:hypothetical protein
MMELSVDQEARLRQQEFPQILRDVIDSGAEQLDLVIDADTALIIAAALELYNSITGIS